jgi:superoxide dismutase, Cu-Zn family
VRQFVSAPSNQYSCLIGDGFPRRRATFEVSMRHVPLAAALLALSAAARAAPPPPVRAIAIMRDGAGKQVGTATLVDEEEGVQIAIVVKGLPPGKHGFHVHTVGRCEGPDFASAGDHFNPGGKAHGPAGAPGSHAGDLPDLVADGDGVAVVGFIARGISLGRSGPTSLLGGGGVTLVVGGGAGDGRGEPGGKRLACGVVTRR